MWLSYGVATPLALLAQKSWVSGLLNEVYNVSVRQLVPEIRAVKVERSKKKPDFLSKTVFFFRLFNFDGLYLKNQLLYRNLIYLIWKPWYTVSMSQIARGRGSPIWQPHPLKWKKLGFHSRWHGCHIRPPGSFIFWLIIAEYQGFPMVYYTFLNFK